MPKLNPVIFASLGGALGATIRFLCLEAAPGFLILPINISGSLVFGFANVCIKDKNIKTAITSGFCGGLTTFSGVSVFVCDLSRHSFFEAAAFAILNLTLSVVAVFCGEFLAKKKGSLCIR